MEHYNDEYLNMVEELEALEAENAELHAQLEEYEEQLEQLEHIEDQYNDIAADADLGNTYKVFVKWLEQKHPEEKALFDKLYMEHSMGNLNLS